MDKIEKEILDIVVRINKLNHMISLKAMKDEKDYRLDVYENFHEVIKNYFLYYQDK